MHRVELRGITVEDHGYACGTPQQSYKEESMFKKWWQSGELIFGFQVAALIALTFAVGVLFWMLAEVVA